MNRECARALEILARQADQVEQLQELQLLEDRLRDKCQAAINSLTLRPSQGTEEMLRSRLRANLRNLQHRKKMTRAVELQKPGES